MHHIDSYDKNKHCSRGENGFKLIKAVDCQLLKEVYVNLLDQKEPKLNLENNEILDIETNIAFGLCDLGMNSPELGYVSIEELNDIRFPPFGLPIERDLHFKANKSIAGWSFLPNS